MFRPRRSAPTYRSLPLLATVLLGFVLSPFAAHATGAFPFLFGLLLILFIGATSSLLTAGRRWPAVFGALVVLAIGIQILDSRTAASPSWLIIADSLLPVAINLLTLYIVLRYVLFRPAIHELDRVLGAICGYFMLAFAWGRIFTALHRLDPSGAFRFADETAHAHNDFLYFSTITLATVGYGDITPSSPAARMFASLEAIVGTLYLAILIATLVSRIPSSPGHSNP